MSETGPPNDRTFEARAVVRVEGTDTVSPPAVARTRRDAEKAASAALLVAMGVEAAADRTAAAGSGPGAAGIASAADRKDDPTVRTRLETLCARRKWNRPTFDVVSAGPPHKPTFEATASVEAGGRVLRTEVFSAGSKKEAERGAAAALLAIVERTAVGSA